ncbi:MAG: ABC transporter ATP-binding protein [Dongiales bacterium]|jgi:multiple sugar transport system ATP-binding protein
MAEVILSGVSKRFGAVPAVSRLSLAVGDGEFVVLLGPTGAGKTTTLRLIAGLEKPDEGTVTIAGRDVTRTPPAERDLTFVFQQYSLYPHLSVYDNLAFPLRSPVRRVPETEIKRKVGEIAELLHISQKLGNKATRLSGGEMQRVAIGRALVRRPAVFLMDEPLSSLDAKLRSELRLELKRIQQDMGATIIYVTHDQIEAMTMATRVGVIEQGHLVQVDSPRQIYDDPANVHVAARLGQPGINLLPRSMFPDMATPAGAHTIGVRTEHLRISKSLNGSAKGKVSWIEHLGDRNHLHVRIADTEVVTLADPDSGLHVGDDVAIEIVRPLYFDVSGNRVNA